MKRLFVWLERLIWPKGVQCLCCGHGSRGELLCSECASELARQRLDQPIAETGSVWQYDGAARQMVLDLKYQCTADCAAVLARGIAERIREMDLPPDTILTWVTMPRRRMLERGIDHGQVLCRAVAAQTGLTARKLLKRRGKVHTQQGLSREERKKNLSGTFVCEANIAVPVLLIDDVLTTGTTTEVCRQALISGGAPRVWVLTATAAVPDRN